MRGLGLARFIGITIGGRANQCRSKAAYLFYFSINIALINVLHTMRAGLLNAPLFFAANKGHLYKSTFRRYALLLTQIFLAYQAYTSSKFCVRA